MKFIKKHYFGFILFTLPTGLSIFLIRMAVTYWEGISLGTIGTIIIMYIVTTVVWLLTKDYITKQ